MRIPPPPLPLPPSLVHTPTPAHQTAFFPLVDSIFQATFLCACLLHWLVFLDDLLQIATAAAPGAKGDRNTSCAQRCSDLLPKGALVAALWVTHQSSHTLPLPSPSLLPYHLVAQTRYFAYTLGLADRPWGRGLLLVSRHDDTERGLAARVQVVMVGNLTWNVVGSESDPMYSAAADDSATALVWPAASSLS